MNVRDRGRAHGPGNPRADRPGDRQSRRQRAQIRRAARRCDAEAKPDVVISARRVGESVVLTVADRGPGLRRQTGPGFSTGSSGSKARVRGRAPGLDFRSPPRSRACMAERSNSRTIEPGLRVRLTLPAADEPPRLPAPVNLVLNDGTLAESLVDAPRLAAPAEARRRLAELLERRKPRPRRELATRPDRDLLLGLADHSPYLWALVRKTLRGWLVCSAARRANRSIRSFKRSPRGATRTRRSSCGAAPRQARSRAPGRACRHRRRLGRRRGD